MTFTFDPRLNVAYIRFAEKTGQVESRELNEDIIVDIDANGKIYGIELLNAREQLQENNSKFQFINSLTKEHREMPLPVF